MTEQSNNHKNRNNATATALTCPYYPQRRNVSNNCKRKVMRLLRSIISVLLLAFFANSTLSGQPIDSIVDGRTYLTPLPKTYIYNHKENVYTIHLLADSCFEYSIQTNELSVKCVGEYKISNDTVYLSFLKNNETDRNCTISDSEKIHICSRLISRKEKLVCDRDKRIVFKLKKREYFI